MKDDLYLMLRKMIFIDTTVGLVLTALVYIAFKGYAFIFLLGYLLACFNFFLSSAVAKYTFYGEKTKSQGILLISSGLKVLFICIVGVIIFKYNHIYVIPYLAGYTCHFIPIIIYGINKKNF